MSKVNADKEINFNGEIFKLVKSTAPHLMLEIWLKKIEANGWETVQDKNLILELKAV